MPVFLGYCLFYILIVLTGVSCSTSVGADTGQSPDVEECVVLLHGLARSSRSMDDMANALQAEDYFTVNMDYPSRSTTVERLALIEIPKVLQICREQRAKRISFVTHSMGGILLRYYLSQEEIAELKRVVMLSPPNKGSEVVDTLRGNFFFEWRNGPAGQQLGTGPDSLLHQLGPATFPLGIITGDEPAFYDLWMVDMIPGPSDGKVSVESAKLEGMTDFLVLPENHTFIINDEEVIRQTLYFLQHEKFDRASFIQE
ncbi:MAG: alpha/beta fold hydrolase [Desulforhopalus sp.]